MEISVYRNESAYTSYRNAMRLLRDFDNPVKPRDFMVVKARRVVKEYRHDRKFGKLLECR